MHRELAVAFACLVVLITVARADVLVPGATREAIGQLPHFKLTDQNGKIVTHEALSGKVCVVSFFFSCCNTFCPKTQAVMAKLQDKFASSPDVLLISINVYPSHDDQTTLKRYAEDKQANAERWLLLRGNEQEIDDLVQKGFYQSLSPNPKPQGGDEIIHTANLMVVDHRGAIRGYVDGTKPDEVERLEVFVQRLVQVKYLPYATLNASLNASCGVLLVLGFLYIKNRNVLAHKVCMLLAVLVSAAFLGCYLYYHFAVLKGQPTRFGGEGPVRTIYLGILFSHTILAVAVAPLALTVTYLGLRNRLARHVILARWTLPVWLYVSVTGVIVYLMLYHLYPPA
jgi:protein SCO1/2/putative membrane protein